MKRVTFIGDVIHETVPVSRIEKWLISTQEFNRLHGVLQNSTGFLTFPSLTHTRWAHSLGVMHIAGQMFVNGFRNAESESRSLFLDEIYGLLNDIGSGTSESSESPWSRLRILQPEVEDVAALVSHVNDSTDPFYDLQFAGEKSFAGRAEHKFALTCAYQAIRLAALLHDVGHLPFSHVSETALTRIHQELKSRKEEGEELSDSEREFVEAISSFKRLSPQQKPDQLHEAIGKELVLHLYEALSEHLRTAEEADPVCSPAFAFIVLRLASLIFTTQYDSKGEAVAGLYGLINGYCDCDRLDFVSRDLLMAGVIRAPLQIGRLVQSMKLLLVADENESVGGEGAEKYWEFYPSVRAVSTVEDVINHRHSLYRYVVFHHRLKKTDELLISLVQIMAREHFRSGSPAVPSYQRRLPDSIDGLWTPIIARSRVSRNTLAGLLSQFDDRWLVGVLRDRYNDLIAKGDGLSSQESRLLDQLEELLSNKKKYYSLFKRAADFRELDQAVYDHLKRKLDPGFDLSLLHSHIKSLDLLDSVKRNLIAGLNKLWDAVKEALEAENGQFPAHTGFFTRLLLDFLSFEIRDFTTPRHVLLRQAIEVACETFDQIKVDHHLWNLNKLKPGITDEFFVYSDTGVVPISSVSRIVDSENDNERFLPPFYVYIKPSDPKQMTAENISALRAAVGDQIGSRFLQTLKGKQSNIAQKLYVQE